MPYYVEQYRVLDNFVTGRMDVTDYEPTMRHRVAERVASDSFPGYKTRLIESTEKLILFPPLDHRSVGLTLNPRQG